jgi:hypothetical protein
MGLRRSRQNRLQQQQQQQLCHPTGTPVADPVEPEPHPDEGEQVPEVTPTSDAGRKILALSQTDVLPHASTDNRATTSVSPDHRPHLAIQTGESEAASTLGVPTGNVTDHHLDDCDVATLHKTATVDHSTAPPPSQAPTMCSAHNMTCNASSHTCSATPHGC